MAAAGGAGAGAGAGASAAGVSDAAAKAAVRAAIAEALPGQALLLYLERFALPSFAVQPLAMPTSATIDIDSSIEAGISLILMDRDEETEKLLNKKFLSTNSRQHYKDINTFNHQILDYLRKTLSLDSEDEQAFFRNLLEVADTHARFLDGRSKLTFIRDKLQHIMYQTILTEKERTQITGSIERDGFTREGVAGSYNRSRPYDFTLHNDLIRGIEEGRILDDYDLSAIELSQIPIYLFLVTPQGHASIMVVFGSKLYSIGLGLEEASSSVRESDLFAQAILMSPDPLVRPEARTASGAPYKYKIADIGILKLKHLARIRKTLEEQEEKKTIRFSYDDDDGGYHLNFFTIPLKLMYSYFSPERGFLGDYYNCVSFATEIFGERVTCSDRGVANPDKCRSKIITDASLLAVTRAEGAVAAAAAGANVFAGAAAAAAVAGSARESHTPAEALFKIYLLAYLGEEVSVRITKFFPVLHNESMGGGGRRRRTRRHRRHRPKKLDRRTRRR